jgi:transmembrane sensor
MRDDSLPQTPEPSLIDRLLAGESNAQDQERFEAWVLDHPDERAFASLVQMASTLSNEPVPHDAERAWTSVSAVMQPNSPANTKGGMPRPFRTIAERKRVIHTELRTRTVRASLGALAVVMIVLGMTLVTRAPSVPSSAPFGRSPSWSHTTGSGQRMTIVLADGSRVTLAPRSRLDVSREFGERERSVRLRGEAYFDVSPKAGAPFVVRTGEITTRVLGTTFDIRRYDTDPTVQVAVMTGRVITHNRRGSTVMVPGMVAQLTDSSVGTRMISGVNDYAGWTEDRLVFDETPVSVMLASVGRWYGYEFHLTDSTIATRHVTTVLHVRDSAKTLAAIEQLLNVRMSFDGPRVTLSPRRSGVRPPSGRIRQILISPQAEVGK